MKVGIDGVLLGSWCDVDDAHTALDIGSGSGLISLMLAQRCNARLDAIDIDADAVKQTQFNFKNSIWSERLKVFHTSVQEFSETETQKYDLIVSNPPYFINSLKAPDNQRSIARHTGTLTHSELLESAVKILKKTGKICLILPVNEGLKCIETGNELGLFCNKKVFVYPKPDSQVKRLLLQFSFTETETEISEITIEAHERHSYTPEFTELVKDFYLKFK